MKHAQLVNENVAQRSTIKSQAATIKALEMKLKKANDVLIKINGLTMRRINNE